MSRAPPPPGQNPVSFKTVPGRNRTQKWQQAKTYNYDGDDWGGYDPYDEYGGQDEPPPQPPLPNQQSYGQSSRLQRTNSFEAGDERRTFSAGHSTTYEEDRNVQMASPGNGRRPRDFTNPEQVPQPLNTRVSPTRASPAPAPVPTGAFPPRKSSIRGKSPAQVAQPPAMNDHASPSADKPLPFIRPSDIYRRMNEEKERERQSQDSGRPSMDAIQREHSAERTSMDSETAPPLRMKPSLDPVAESRESMIQSPQQETIALQPRLPDEVSRDLETTPRQPATAFAGAEGSTAAPPRIDTEQHLQSSTFSPLSAPQPQIATTKQASPMLPPVTRMSGFGGFDDFMSGSQSAAQTEGQRGSMASQSPEDTAARVFNAPVESADGSAQQMGAGLSHQPSSGFRSAVNTAFDRQDDNSVPATPSSQNDSLSVNTAGVNRSDTTSTSGISPIMGALPSGAMAQQFPTVHEEPAQTGLLPSTTYQVPPRKSSPAHSRNLSDEAANVQPGYRRSLDPPSNGSSPARTPAVDDASNRRLSTPMVAETLHATEEPDVKDQAAEIPEAHLERTGSQVPGIQEPNDAVEEYTKALPLDTGRGRSGTNYSLRESDLARTINASPDEGSFSPAAAEAERASREQFLRDHASSPSTPLSASFGPRSPGANAAGLGILRSNTPGSTKGRVREIADKYHDLHEAARRDSEVSITSSKSSWSNFRGSEENLHAPVAGGSLSRKNTGSSQLALSTKLEERAENMSGQSRVESPDSMFPQYENSRDGNALAVPSTHGDNQASESRQSFRPSIPGQWISATPTPSNEEPPELYSTEDQNTQETSVEPSTPRVSHSFEEGDSELTPTSRRMQARDSLGAPDFAPTPSSAGGSRNASSDHVRAAGTALGASLLTNAGLTSQPRDFANPEPAAPLRQPELEPHQPIGDVYGASRLQAAPPLERGESFATEGTASIASLSPQKELAGEPQENVKPAGGYFNNAGQPAPLALHKSAQQPRLDGTVDTNVERANVMGTPYAESPGAGDMESDRLRREIVRSLDPMQRDSEQSTEEGNRALNKKFSWERTDEDSQPATAAAAPPKIIVPQPQREHDISPEMPYERPRSRGLHIMNPEEDEDGTASPIVPTKSITKVTVEQPVTHTTSAVSPLEPKSTMYQEPMRADTAKSAQEDGALNELAPSPISERRPSDTESFNTNRLPSYYLSGGEALGLGAAGGAAGGAAVVAGTHAARTSEERSKDVDDSLLETPSKADKQSADKQTASPVTPKPSATRTTTDSPRIPPFREILAVKSAPQRIEAYTSTRETFANMDTGLNDWLQGMMIKHPEHAGLADVPPGGYKSVAPLQSSSTFRMGHRKASPSLARFTSLAPGGGSGPTGERKTSFGAGEGDKDATAGDAMQQRGKEFIKTAGVFGGKAQAGAKGLFAKGKSRFGKKDGGDAKAPSSLTPSHQQRPRTLAPPPPSLSQSHQHKSRTLAPPPSLPLSSASSSRKNTSSNSSAPTPPTANQFVSQLGIDKSQSNTTLSSLASSNLTSNATLPVTHPLPNTASQSRGDGMTSRSNSSQRISNALERLRTHSRSLSRSRSERSTSRPGSIVSSRSRPSSMLLGHLETMQEPTTGENDDANTETGAVKVAGHEAPPLEVEGESLPPVKKLRTEAWENDRDIPAGLPPTPAAMTSTSPPRLSIATAQLLGTSTPPRLGVLPSPVVDSSSFGDGSPARQRERISVDGVIEETERDDHKKNTFVIDDAQPPAGNGIESAFIEKDTPTANIPLHNDSGSTVKPIEEKGESFGPMLHTEGETTGLVDEPAEYESAEPESARTQSGPDSTADNMPERPHQERRVSARSTLPSQRRASSSTAPRTPTNELGFWRRSIPDGAALTALLQNVRKGEDDDIYETTPRTPGGSAPWRNSIARSTDALASTREASPEREPDDQASGRPRPLSGVHLTSSKTFLRDGEGETRDDDVPPVPALPARDPEGSGLLSATTQGHSRNYSWDRGSGVSAEDFMDAHETPLAKEIAPLDSRRSSISSLGAMDTRDKSRPSPAAASGKPPDADMPVMLAHAVPAGPIGVSRPDDVVPPVQTAETTNHTLSRPTPDNVPPAFMNRMYKGHVASQERPMSYMPLPRSSTGAPMHESIDIAGRANPTSAIDISGYDGPPAGTAPFQQHPALRNSTIDIVPKNADAARPPISESNATAPVKAAEPPVQARPRKSSVEGRQGRRNRISGLFRRQSSDRNVPDLPTSPTAPPAHRISAQFGLDDVHASTPDPVPPVRTEQRPEVKQSKRKSGIWDSLRGSEASSRADLSNATMGRNSTSVIGIQGVDSARPNTLRKPQQLPQRAATTVTAPSEPKKKRFSSFGSLFSRSSTSARSSPKPQKLTKTQQLEDDNEQRRSSGPIRSNTANVTGYVSNYEAYEAMRRQQIPDLAKPAPAPSDLPRTQSSPEQHQQRPMSLNKQLPPMPRIPLDFPQEPPPGGWYAPKENESARPQTMYSTPAYAQQSPYMATQQPSVGRVHGEEDRRRSLNVVVPESFRPIAASYGQQVAPVGPPEDSANSPVYGPTSRGYGSLQRSPHATRNPSWGRQPSLPTQPVAYGASPRSRHSSYGSIPYQASAPVPSQPPMGGWQQRGSVPSIIPVQNRSVSSPMDHNMARSPAREYAGQQTPWSISLPSEPEGTGRRSRPQSRPQSRPHSWAMPSTGPPMPEYSSSGPPPIAGSYQSQGPRNPRPNQQQRYYDNQRRQNSYNSDNDAPLAYRRTSSTYSGRRDDPGVNEEAIMRGASYPGQEWTPEEGR